MPWVPNDAKERGCGEKRRAFLSFLGSRGRDPHNSLQTKRQKERKRERHPKIGKTKGNQKPKKLAVPGLDPGTFFSAARGPLCTKPEIRYGIPY